MIFGGGEEQGSQHFKKNELIRRIVCDMKIGLFVFVTERKWKFLEGKWDKERRKVPHIQTWAK